MLIAVVALLGLLGAWILGPDRSRLGELKLRATWLGFTALAVQLAIFTPWSSTLPDTAKVSLHLASYALLLAFLALNVRVPGLWIAATGFACNLLVISANGGRMPVSLDAWSASGGDAGIHDSGTYDNVVLADTHTRLHWLGDILPIHAHPLANALSLGDLLLIAGITTVAYRACRPHKIEPTERTPRIDHESPARSGEPLNREAQLRH